LAILVLQELADPPHLVVDVGELTHDSRDVAMLDRRLDDRIVVTARQLRKMAARDEAAFRDGASAGTTYPCTGYG
jgi:hypothetical protein